MSSSRNNDHLGLDPVLLVAYAMHLGEAIINPLFGTVMDLARANEKRPAYLKIATTDEVVKNIKGAEERRAFYCMVTIPREVVEGFLAKANSRIITPPGVLADPG